MIGKRFGRLLVVKEVERASGVRCFLCLCSCGKETIAMLQNLRSGGTKSCGCLRYESMNRKHGGKGTRLYRIFSGIKNRCFNQKTREYKEYGGRGIGVCSEWLDFENFRSWAENSGYADHLTIERVDVNGNYEPSNCTWITKGEQASNRTNTLYAVYQGERRTLKDWSKRAGVEYQTLYSRITYRKWDIEKALSTPSLINRKNKESV